MVRFTWRAFTRLAFASLFLALARPLAANQSAAAAPPAFNFAQAIAETRTAWKKHSARIAQLLPMLKTNAGVAARLDPQISSLLGELKALEHRKQVELEELRQGMFCSGCGKTRSEILAAGETFPHSGQQSIPASPEQIAAAEKEFDDRIRALRRRLDALQAERKQAQSAIDAALHELNTVIHHYHQQMLVEARHRGAEWADEKRRLELGLDTLQQSMNAAEATFSAPGDALAADAARANLDILRTQFTTSLQRAQAAEARARQESATFSTTVKSDLERLRQLALDVPQQFGIPGGWFLGQRVSTPPLPVSYFVTALRNYAPAKTSDALRSLLEGPKKGPGPTHGAPSKSVRELLEGK
jgi:hypothetical protein